MAKKPWSDFENIQSHSFVSELLPQALAVHPEWLMDMAHYKREERIQACGGTDPLSVIVAYAQDSLIYDKGHIRQALRPEYESTSREERVNKFGIAYRSDAKLWLHRTLADITISAAIYLYQTQGWRTVLFDGLRTVDGAYQLYLQANDSDMESGLLSLPGRSAHNKGLAVDSMMFNAEGIEVPMGAHFDHLDMRINGRHYFGDEIDEHARQNRFIREAAFLRSALTQGLLIAPLRNEFWDDRLPENRQDLWRVLDSAARCMGRSLLSGERRRDRGTFAERFESWDYPMFQERWHGFFQKQKNELQDLLGVDEPPAHEQIEFYHGNYQPIYDAQLRAADKHLVSP